MPLAAGSVGGERLQALARIAVVMTLTAALVGCASVPDRPPRLAASSYGCMQAVVQEKLPADLTEARAHCLAAGLIARYCSAGEAYLASAGKELRDLWGGGDAEWSDWRADRAGLGCARSSRNDADLADCCSARGY